jgi:predicted nucleic acid-binding protein
MAEKYSLERVADLKDRKVFFDANVFIYLFWPTGENRWIHSYSRLYKELLKQGNAIVTDFLVISEIINRMHRIEHGNYLNRNQLSNQDFKYKQYRDSDTGKQDLSDIFSVVQHEILDNFTILGKSFGKQDIAEFMVIGKLDFNDKAIESICRDNDCVLVTNDADFSETDIDILSANPRLLRV